MGTGIKQKATTGDGGDLAPGIDRVDAPILPHYATNGFDGTNVAVAQHIDGGTYIGREAPGEGDDQQFAGAIAGCNQAFGFGTGHYHWLFEQYVNPSLETGSGLIVVVGVGSNDEGGVDSTFVVAEQLSQIRLVGGDRQASFFEDAAVSS
jgi:hypothetical protein